MESRLTLTQEFRVQFPTSWFGPVAQMDRAPAYEADNCRFESCRDHFNYVYS